jgi:outer membrane protein assembly factor BamB
VKSAPAVANGLVYATAHDGALRALRAADGSVAWTLATGAALPLAWGFESGQLYESSPALADGGATVVVGALDGYLYAADARTGKARWRHRVGARVYSSPAVAGGVVYVGAQDGTVHAVSLADGRPRWTFATDGARLKSADFGFDRTTVQSSPAVADGTVYVGARDGFLYAIDAATGRERWRADHKVSWVNSSPAVSDGLVYAASSDGHFVQALDAATGAERWRTPTTLVVWASPTVDARHLYVGEGDGTLYALDKRTGKEAWRWRGGARILSTVAAERGRLYVGSDDGSVYAIAAADGAPMRRAVFWDSASATRPFGVSRVPVRNYLVARGYELLDAAGLARFMAERVRDRAPSSVVFAVDHAPATVAPVAADTVLFRRYLDAGGTVVWLGNPPLIAPPNAQGLKDLDRDAPRRLLGVGFARGNFDPLGVPRVTPEGRQLGLHAWYLDAWAAEPATVTTVLAYDERGEAAAWVKRFGGAAGGALVRLFAGDGAPGRPTAFAAVQTAAELRPR